MTAASSKPRTIEHHPTPPVHGSLDVRGRRSQRNLAADESLPVGKRHNDAAFECHCERFKGQAKILVKDQDHGAEDINGGEIFVIDGYLLNASAGAAPQTVAALRVGAPPGGLGWIVIISSGAAYLSGGTETGYTASKAAVCRYGDPARHDPGRGTGTEEQEDVGMLDAQEPLSRDAHRPRRFRPGNVGHG